MPIMKAYIRPWTSVLSIELENSFVDSGFEFLECCYRATLKVNIELSNVSLSATTQITSFSHNIC